MAENIIEFEHIVSEILKVYMGGGVAWRREKICIRNGQTTTTLTWLPKIAYSDFTELLTYTRDH